MHGYCSICAFIHNFTPIDVDFFKKSKCEKWPHFCIFQDYATNDVVTLREWTIETLQMPWQFKPMHLMERKVFTHKTQYHRNQLHSLWATTTTKYEEKWCILCQSWESNLRAQDFQSSYENETFELVWDPIRTEPLNEKYFFNPNT